MKVREYIFKFISIFFLFCPLFISLAQTSPYPNTPLGPGLKNDPTAVQYLQNYLIGLNNPRYDIPAGATSFYGPQTTQAVTNLQQDLGVDNSSGPGFYGPKTIGAVSAGYWTGSLVSTNEGNQNLPQIPTVPGQSSPYNPGGNGGAASGGISGSNAVHPLGPFPEFGGQVTNSSGLSQFIPTCGCSDRFNTSGNLAEPIPTHYIVDSNEAGTVPKPIHLLLTPETIISTPNTRIPVAYKNLPPTDTFNLGLDTCILGNYIPDVTLARNLCLDFGPSSNPSDNVIMGSGAEQTTCHKTYMPLEGVISLLKVQEKSACQPTQQI